MRWLVVRSIVVITAVTALGCITSACHRVDSYLTTTSPNSTFVVHLMESEAGFSKHVVRFDVTKHNQPLIENREFYFNSTPFISTERKYSWVDENLLRFGEIRCCVHDEISISNQAGKVIRYLRFDAGDTYLLLELQPGQKVQLQVNAQTDQGADISWIGGSGAFADGKEFLNWGRNFHIRGQYKAPAHYCIEVQESGVIVQSREGFQSEGAGNIVPSSEAKGACE